MSEYHDTFDSKKSFVKTLFRPGKVQQSREMNEVQSTQLDIIKRLGDSIMQNGYIVEGCSIILKGKTVIVGKGKVYLHGIVRDIEETEIEILGKGFESIGVKLVQTVITEVEDPTLRDPAQGYDNYSQAGAHRLKETVKITINDTESASIYNIENGDLLVTSEEKPNENKFVDMMARRTYDETGNYVVRGLSLSDKGIHDENIVNVSLEGGKAYICGYEINKPASSTIKLEKSKSVRKVLNEPKIYATDTNQYLLNSHPTKKINKAVAIVQVEQNITRGNIGSGLDYLPKTPVVSIVEVKSGAKVYKNGFDYRLTSDGVDWSPSGDKPSIGSTYSVTWTYNKVLERDKDYKLSVLEKQSFIEFSEGDVPVSGTTMLVDYDFYLARKDIICLDKNGRINVIQGQPDIQRFVFAPSNNNPDLLKIGVVLLPANGNIPIIDNKTVTAIPMEKLHDFIERIEEVEYNQALIDLDEEAIEGESASQLKGVLTDNFMGFSKIDFNHEDFGVSLDILSQELLLPQTQFQYIPVIKENSKSKASGRLVFAPYTEAMTIIQNTATDIMKVNPYMVFPGNPLINLDPSMDSWIDSKIVEAKGNDIVKTVYLRNLYSQSVTQHSVTTKILEDAITFMRSIEVKVTAEKFPALTDKICAVFDGVPVDLTPKDDSYKSDFAGMVKSNTSGVLEASFTIPPNIKTGTKDLMLYSKNIPNLTATAQFTANGRQKTTFNTVYREIINYRPIDPLAQSFGFETDKLVTSVGLFFAAKDKEKIIVQIRGITNGFPNAVVYAEKVLSEGDIKTSTDSSTETKVTFNDPVFCRTDEQYCIVILTESAVTSVYISTLGEKDLITKKQILKQPYSVGVMFSSSNAITWTPHQTQDLKFNIYTAKFESDGLLEFEEFSVQNIDRILLLADYVTPTGTKMEWEYQSNDNGWLPIAEYSEVMLSKKTEKISLRAKIKATESVSPALALDTFCNVGFVTQLAGSYISRNVAMARLYTEIKQTMDLALPAGTSVVVKYATDTDGKVWNTIPNTGVEPVTNNFSRYTFSKTIEPATNFRCKIELYTTDQCVEPRIKKLINILK